MSIAIARMTRPAITKVCSVLKALDRREELRVEGQRARMRELRNQYEEQLIRDEEIFRQEYWERWP